MNEGNGNAEQDSTTEAHQTEQAKAETIDINTQEAVVETVIPYWRVPHCRAPRGPLTGYRP
jgi:membrane protein YdbS with pleckstrin-like domain